jgi:hypothetical protein
MLVLFASEIAALLLLIDSNGSVYRLVFGFIALAVMFVLIIVGFAYGGFLDPILPSFVVVPVGGETPARRRIRRLRQALAPVALLVVGAVIYALAAKLIG